MTEESLPGEVLLLVFQHLMPPPTYDHCSTSYSARRRGLSLSLFNDDWGGIKALVAAGGVCWRWRHLAGDDSLWCRMHAAVLGGPLLPAWLKAPADALLQCQLDRVMRWRWPAGDFAGDRLARQLHRSESVALPRRLITPMLIELAQQVLGKSGRSAFLPPLETCTTPATATAQATAECVDDASHERAARMTWRDAFLAKAKDLQSSIFLLSSITVTSQAGALTPHQPRHHQRASELEEPDADHSTTATATAKTRVRSIRRREAMVKQSNKIKAKKENRRLDGTRIQGQAERAILLGCEALVAKLVAYYYDKAGTCSSARNLIYSGLRHPYALLWACSVPSPAMLSMLRAFEPEPCIDLEPWPHQLAMLAAAENGRLDLMRKLCRQSVRVEARKAANPHRWSGWSVHLAGSCLFRAKERDMIELVWQQVEDTNGSFQWPYYFNQAAYMGNLEAVRFFFSVWQGDEDFALIRNTLLTWAVRGAQERVATYLLDEGARWNGQGLSEAILLPTFDQSIFSLLISRAQLKLDGHSECWTFFTRGPVERGDERFCRFLVSHGADINVTGKVGGNLHLTPLQLAASNNNLRQASCLLRCGANPRQRHNTSRSAMSLAKRKGFTEMVDLLIAHRPPRRTSRAPAVDSDDSSSPT